MGDFASGPPGPRSQAASTAVQSELAPAPSKGILRVLTCGSVDDGKSTLIGRLLYECNAVPVDVVETLQRDSQQFGTTGVDLDLALLVDGLQAEREQGITIDVAYRYFASPRRSFIVADTPGHEQYTRNMATGASVSDLAIILIDARKGVLTQTRRHSYIVHLLGIRQVVVCVNKMDLVDFSEETFDAIRTSYLAFAQQLGIRLVTVIPVSARRGHNIGVRSRSTPWYDGPTLLEHLEVADDSAEAIGPLRFPVQWVNRPNLDFRGFSGTVAGGSIEVGQDIVALPSARTAKVARIVTGAGDVEKAKRGAAVTVVLNEEIDVSRGDVLVGLNEQPEATDQLAAMIIWMSEERMLPGRSYLIKCGQQWSNGTVSALKHKVSMTTLEGVPAHALELNDIGFCNVSSNRPLVFDPYEQNRTMGSFILVDRMTYRTVGAGLILYALRRATNIHWQAVDINKAARASLIHQKPCCLWFTGLSGSGKSTIANLLEKRLHAAGRLTYNLDGDNIRHGLSRDLGFTDADRVENIRRVAHVAKLMVDAGVIVLACFISPFRAERRMVREMLEKDEFVEIFVDTPIAVCEQRDPKGLYRKAREGKITNFTGISSPYEIPEQAEIHVRAGETDVNAIVEQIMDVLRNRKLMT